MLSSTGKNDESMNFNINVKRKDSSSPSSSFSSSTNSNSSSKRIKFNPIVYEKKYGVSKAPNDSEMNKEEAKLLKEDKKEQNGNEITPYYHQQTTNDNYSNHNNQNSDMMNESIHPYEHQLSKMNEIQFYMESFERKSLEERKTFYRQ